MARVCKLTHNDGHAILAITSNRFDEGRIRVDGKLAYVTIETKESFVVLSGRKTLLALAKAIQRACK